MMFTVEETNFMSYFNTSSRGALIHDMKTTPLNDLDDEMTDDQFGALYIAPDELLD